MFNSKANCNGCKGDKKLEGTSTEAGRPFGAEQGECDGGRRKSELRPLEWRWKESIRGDPQKDTNRRHRERTHVHFRKGYENDRP